MPEGRAGYLNANAFYQGQLDQPSVYMGQRYADPTAMQRGALDQAQGTMGGPEGPGYRQYAGSEAMRTMGGDYLSGPEGQAAVKGLAQPIFERFENQTMPGIRDAAQFSGGAGGSRRTVANMNAVQDLGYNIGQGAVAPIFEGERNRMTRQAIEGSQGLAQQDIARTQGLSSLGEIERKLNELPISAQRDAFEEGLARRAGGAESLASMASVGPGGSQNFYSPSGMRMFLGSGKA